MNFQQLKKKKLRGFSTHFVVFRVLMSAVFLFKNGLYIGEGQHFMDNILKTDQQSLRDCSYKVSWPR